MIPTAYEKYSSARGVRGPWSVVGDTGCGFAGIVVIPALAESATLFATLSSLAANPSQLLARFLILVVVNNRPDAPLADKTDNRLTLARLSAAAPQLAPLRLAWVDAASPGLELPAKKGGVGLARKIGFDLALPLLDYCRAAPLLIALDGDTLVQPDYLSALVHHFRSAAVGGAVIPFRHQAAASPAEQVAIDRYELFLRSYVLGLATAGSPYGFHTVGSAMACTAAAYVSAGGMNSRVAAEDFYFLQQLRKTTGIAHVGGTVVHPSPRPSHRVPFGTGKSVARLLHGDATAVLFYRLECYQILQQWLALVVAMLADDGAGICRRAREISPCLAEYLDQADFATAWNKLRRNSRDAAALLAAFHAWFDGLRTMQLIHHLSNELLPREVPENVLPELLAWAGLPPLRDRAAQLALLREQQGAVAAARGTSF
jgi:hypothetical protein